MSEVTLGGYMAKHERAAAFGGSDGQAYSVGIYVDEEPDARGRYGAALLFVRWSPGGDRRSPGLRSGGPSSPARTYSGRSPTGERVVAQMLINLTSVEQCCASLSASTRWRHGR